jgi:hypothetical protein
MIRPPRLYAGSDPGDRLNKRISVSRDVVTGQWHAQRRYGRVNGKPGERVGRIRNCYRGSLRCLFCLLALSARENGCPLTPQGKDALHLLVV